MENLHFASVRSPCIFHPLWKLNVEVSGQMKCLCKTKYY